MGSMSYEELCASHRWEVPERYNIAADVCDKHPRDKPAMVWESFDGVVRELTWGELQDLANQAAHMLAARGVERGDRVAVVLPPTPETAAVFFGVWKLGAILLSMSVLYGDEGIQHRLADSRREAARHRRRQRSALRPAVVARRRSCSRRTAWRRRRPTSCRIDTAADDPAQLYYTSGTTGLAKGIVHAHRYILGHEEFVYCHEVQDGERFHGMGEWAWAAGIAPLLGPWRLGALQCVYRREGGFDPHKQLDFLSRHRVTNVFTTPTAMRSMMAIEDAGTRYPQQFRRRLLGGRAAEPRGDPLVPRPVRRDGARLLRPHRVVSAVSRTTRSMEVREGSMGKPMPGWDVQLLDEDEQPVAAGERGEICLRARSNPHYPLGYWRNEEASAETFGGEWFHTKDAAVAGRGRLHLVRGRADDVIIAAGYRIGPFEVESACLEHPAVREAAAVASPDELRGNVVKAFIVLADGYEASDELADEIKRFVRERLSAYAYPRRIEFVGRLAEDADGQDPPDRAAPARTRPRQHGHAPLTSRRRRSAAVFRAPAVGIGNPELASAPASRGVGWSVRAVVRKRWVQSSAWRRVSAKTIGMPGLRTWRRASWSASQSPLTCSSLKSAL